MKKFIKKYIETLFILLVILVPAWGVFMQDGTAIVIGTAQLLLVLGVKFAEWLES